MSNERLIMVNVLALALYAVAANPTITGLAIHEWVSLGVFVMFVLHAAQHYDWLLDALKKLRTKPSPGQTSRLVLNVFTVVTFMVTTVSGIMVSRFILSLFGLVAPGYFFWNPLHSLSAKVLLALVVIHLVVNINRFIMLLRSRGKKDEREKKESPEHARDE